MATLSDQLNIAMHHHQAGRLQLAEQIYRQVLATNPNQPDALHLLGVLAHQAGKHEIAVQLIEAAIGLRGTTADFHSNLGEAYRTLGRYSEASACFRRALELKPDFAGAHNNLGLVLHIQGQPDAAVLCYGQALRLEPSFVHAHLNLGNALMDQGRFSEAIACYRRALELKSDLADAHKNLGNALRQQGQISEAICCYQRAIQLQPNDADIYNNLGVSFQDQCRQTDAIACFQRALQLEPGLAMAHNNLGLSLHYQDQLDAAVQCYRQALQLKPDYTAALMNLGSALTHQGQLGEAIASFQQALELEPDSFGAHCNLGNTFKQEGRIPEAIGCFRRALELKPDFVVAHSNLVYNLHFCTDYDAGMILEEHRRWNQRHAEPLARFIVPHANDPARDRRLRIGYISPDFTSHPVGRFLLPLLEAHDHACVQIFCYGSVRIPDNFTERCQGHADVWRNVLGLSDEQVAQTIRQDRIDILVDLTMHMGENRLLVFARKPAPVQVTYLAYCGTTGVSTMDYRLTDPYLDPPGQGNEIYAEQSIWLPQTYWCYQPPIETPEVNSLPALNAGHVTFGCLNNFCKVTEPTLIAWCDLLQALPEARLLLHAYAGSHRDQVREFFRQRHVAPERLTFTGMVSLREYFEIYRRMDVALDPFPYGGGTTTCDALWMGVPVVSLAGKIAVGRAGLSILSNVGLADLVARTIEDYVRIGVELANDLPRLISLRAGLRERMQASPLMDASRFARNIEAAYRDMWQRWCEPKKKED